MTRGWDSRRCVRIVPALLLALAAPAAAAASGLLPHLGGGLGVSEINPMQLLASMEATVRSEFPEKTLVFNMTADETRLHREEALFSQLEMEIDPERTMELAQQNAEVRRLIPGSHLHRLQEAVSHIRKLALEWPAKVDQTGEEGEAGGSDEGACAPSERAPPPGKVTGTLCARRVDRIGARLDRSVPRGAVLAGVPSARGRRPGRRH